MKVLFVATVYQHLVNFHIPFMQLLQKKGYEVWAVGEGDKYAKNILENYGVICVDLTLSRNPLALANIKAYKDMKILIKEKSFDLIHVHTPIASILTRIAFRNMKKGKLLYTAHGFHFFKGAPLKNWFLYYNAEKIARKWTDGLLVINEEDYHNALKMGYEKENVYLVHGVGVDIPSKKKNINELLNLKKEIGVSQDNIVLSYIAELNDNKNQKFLLRNWPIILSQNPNALLLIIGSGEREDELREYIKSNNLENVKLLGFRSDISNILEITDFVALLSKREGLPKSIMEAMAYKKPCVVTNTRGLRDLIINGENGFVIEHDDDNGLQNAIVTLFNSSKLRSNMGEQGFKLVQQYKLNTVLAEYENIYNKYLNL